MICILKLSIQFLISEVIDMLIQYFVKSNNCRKLLILGLIQKRFVSTKMYSFGKELSNSALKLQWISHSY